MGTTGLTSGSIVTTVGTKHDKNPEHFPVLLLTRRLLLRRNSFMSFCNVDNLVDVDHSLATVTMGTSATVPFPAMSIGDSIARKLLLGPIATLFRQSFPPKNEGARPLTVKASLLQSALVAWIGCLDCLVGHPQ